MANQSTYYVGNHELKVDYEDARLKVTVIKRDGAKFWAIALVDVELLPEDLPQSVGITLVYQPEAVSFAAAKVFVGGANRPRKE